eukprot:gene27090-29861_t
MSRGRNAAGLKEDAKRTGAIEPTPDTFQQASRDLPCAFQHIFGEPTDRRFFQQYAEGVLAPIATGMSCGLDNWHTSAISPASAHGVVRCILDRGSAIERNGSPWQNAARRLSRQQWNVQMIAPVSCRQHWLDCLLKVVAPVLHHGSRRSLKSNLPASANGPDKQQGLQTPRLEACARTLAGISPWLELEGLQGNEAQQQGTARTQAKALLVSLTSPNSPDYLTFSSHHQCLVEAAYLSQAIIRAPRRLWGELSLEEKRNIVVALRSTRLIKPAFNNWLLFSAMVEVFFLSIQDIFDPMRIDYAIRQMEQ